MSLQKSIAEARELLEGVTPIAQLKGRSGKAPLEAIAKELSSWVGLNKVYGIKVVHTTMPGHEKSVYALVLPPQGDSVAERAIIDKPEMKGMARKTRPDGSIIFYPPAPKE